MTAEELIRRLQREDPETPIVLMSRIDGYDDPMMGVQPIVLVRRRPKVRVVGYGKFENIECREPTRAERIKAVVLC